MKKVKRKGTRKMRNTYVLQQAQRTRLLERKWVRIALSTFLGMGAAAAAVSAIVIICGMEFGPIMLGRRILGSALMILIMVAMIAAENALGVELPWDRGEDDE